jgi:hypothetical protein
VSGKKRKENDRMQKIALKSLISFFFKVFDLKPKKNLTDRFSV